MIPPIVHLDALLAAVHANTLVFELQGEQVTVEKRDLYYHWPEALIVGDIYEIEVDGWNNGQVRNLGGRWYEYPDDKNRREARKGKPVERRIGPIRSLTNKVSPLLTKLAGLVEDYE